MEIKDYLLAVHCLKSEGEKQKLREELSASGFTQLSFSISEELALAAQRQKQMAAKHQHQIISCLDQEYPLLLREIYDFPLILYCWGNLQRLKDSNKIAIIGTRKPTYDAKKICDCSCRVLANYQYTIVSGLALGTDGLAHRGALTYGANTIAVLASAVNDITPRSHDKLAEQIIAKNGLILSETPYGQSTQSFMFVKRNRIISGLSEKIFIVEAGKNSGSMTTAKHAMEQNRMIYAMPGSISNPVAYGTNKLIQDGAYPVLAAEDLLGTMEETVTEEKNKVQHPIMMLLQEHGPLEIEHLSILMDLPIHLLMTELTMLEFQAKISIDNNSVHLS